MEKLLKGNIDPLNPPWWLKLSIKNWGLVSPLGETSLPLSSLILHTDRGPEFVSKPWAKLFQKYPFLCGSMSPPFHPISNAVMERFHRSFKNLLQYIHQIQDNYYSKKIFMTDFYKRVSHFNYLCGLKRPHSLPPFWFSKALKLTKR